MNNLKLNDVVFGQRVNLPTAIQQLKGILTERAQNLVQSYQKAIYSDSTTPRR